MKGRTVGVSIIRPPLSHALQPQAHSVTRSCKQTPSVDGPFGAHPLRRREVVVELQPLDQPVREAERQRRVVESCVVAMNRGVMVGTTRVMLYSSSSPRADSAACRRSRPRCCSRQSDSASSGTEPAEALGEVVAIGQNYAENQGDVVYQTTILLVDNHPAMRWGMTAEVEIQSGE